jgi:S-DNA-T family DNA segregation ATPase FtsK/SpoIIIE
MTEVIIVKKKKRTKSITQKKRRTHEIAGVLVASLGLFFGLAVYFREYSGAAGRVLSGVLRGLFGLTAYLLPVLTVMLGIWIILSKHRKSSSRKWILSVVTVYFLLCLFHLFYFPNFITDSGLKSFVLSSYHEGKGQETRGTGAVCAPFSYLIYSLFGLPGAFIFIITVMMINLLLLTNLSLKQVACHVYGFLHLGDAGKGIAKFGKMLSAAARKQKVVFEERKLLTEPDQSAGKTDGPESVPHPEEPEVGGQNEDSQTPEIRIIDFLKEKDQEERGRPDKGESSQKPEGRKEEPAPEIKTQQESLPYMTPPVSLLQAPVQKKRSALVEKTVVGNARLLEETLKSFGVSARVNQVSRGPVITRYELQPAPGVKVSRIVSLSDDIALNLAAPGVRIEAPIPGKAAIGIEVPNKDVAPVLLREVLESDSFFNHPSRLAFALGKDIAGKNVIADIAKMPHMLIAGATGSGKSVCINSLIVSILYKATPDEVRLIMIDPKVVELNTYNGIPHLMIPVVTDPKKAAGALNWTVQEMVSRYRKFADKGVRDIETYNGRLPVEETRLPQIVVIIDELSDLMMVAPGDVEDAICRLAQMARAAGIHLVIATQRPSVDVITGVIKANIPSRIAFAVSSQTDSRTILDMGGAEKLLGRGDMLFYPSGMSKPIRVQGAYVTEKEVESVVNCIKNQNAGPDYNMEVMEETAAEEDNKHDDYEDELLPDAIEVVIDAGQASISMIQRRLRVGYARAARLIDEMEKRGLISGFDGSKPRNVLISKEEFEEQYKEG